MDKVSNIKLKTLSYDKTLGTSKLDFNLSGKNIDHVIINTLRRVAMTDIPIYAYKKFSINKNTSVFNNNYLKLYISNIPVWGIKNNLDKVPEKTDNISPTLQTDEAAFDETMGIMDNSVNESKISSSSLDNLTMYLDYKNDTNDIVSVTTNDAQFHYNGKKLSSPYPVPIILVKLQPKQEINFDAITDINTEKEDAIYSALSIFTFKMNNDHDYDISLESRGQVLEKRIIKLSCQKTIELLQDFYQKVPNNTGLEGEIIVPNADHTLGNLIAHGMLLHTRTIMAAYNVPHPLNEEIKIQYKIKNSNIKIIIGEVIGYYAKVFNSISKLI